MTALSTELAEIVGARHLLERPTELLVYENDALPGYHKRPRLAVFPGSRDEVIATMVERQPVKRFVETEEVANTIAFLASDASAGINGACVPVDLGLLVS